MKRPLLLAVLALLASVAAGAASWYAPQRATRRGVPLPEHKRLLPFVGQWEGEGKYYLNQVGEPLRLQATETNRMVGQLWLVSDLETNQMDFASHTVIGYDPEEGKFIGSFVGSFYPLMSRAEVVENQADRTVITTFRSYNPAGVMVRFKIVQTWLDDDTRRQEIYATGDDGEQALKSELLLKRK